MTSRQKDAATWAVAFLPFLGFWATGLFDVDEGFYAAVVSEMARRGDWLIPTYNGLPWFEKPILLYWLTGPAIAAFGEQFGPRLPSVLASLGTMALCNWHLRRHWDDEIGRAAILALSSTLLFVAIGNMMLTDMPLVFFLTGAFVFYLEALGGRRGGRALSAACLGLAVLAKGPMAIAVFGAVILWSAIEERHLRREYKRGWAAYALILAAVISAWYVPAFLARPSEFFHLFLLKQNVYRLVGGDDAHRVPGWLYVPFYIIVLAALTLPWWRYSLSAWPKRREGSEFVAVAKRTWGRWFWVVLLLFTASGSKLPHYILPAVPPLILLAATARPSKRLLYAATAAVALAAWTLIPAYYDASGQREAHRLARHVRREGGRMASFRIRPDERSVAPQTTLRETSLPSLNFYTNQEISDLQSVREIAQRPEGSFLFTRTGRVSPKDLAECQAHGIRLERIEPETRRYELYRILRN